MVSLTATLLYWLL